MARRIPENVLVFPFRKNEIGEYEYAVFKRSDDPFWQGISGGLEEGEKPEVTASREAFEEAGIPRDRNVYRLDSHGKIPAHIFSAHKDWGDRVYLVDEHHFVVEANDVEIKLSIEHDEYKWLNYEQAKDMLKFDSNKTALYELHHRLLNDDLELA